MTRRNSASKVCLILKCICGVTSIGLGNLDTSIGKLILLFSSENLVYNINDTWISYNRLHHHILRRLSKIVYYNSLSVVLQLSSVSTLYIFISKMFSGFTLGLNGTSTIRRITIWIIHRPRSCRDTSSIYSIRT